MLGARSQKVRLPNMHKHLILFGVCPTKPVRQHHMVALTLWQ